MDSIDQRQLAWVESLGKEIERVTPLEGDVSPRRYFRLRPADGRTVILASYPPSEIDAFRRFQATTRLFESARIRVPEILASNPHMGLMLVEDLGSISLFDQAIEARDSLRRHLQDALESLATLAARPSGPFSKINPPLDARRLNGELRDARAVFLDLDEFSGDEPTRRALLAALDRLMSALALDPLVASHRDFMSRNLMLPPDGSRAAVIDHQDACLAPRYYDLASLLNDSLFPTRGQEHEYLAAVGVDSEQMESYRRCAVQRTLKATATYVKFALRGSERHLPLVQPTLARTALQLEQLPEGRDLPDALYALWRDPESISRGLARLLEPSRDQAPGARC